MPCTTILVGKKASYDGSTMIARNDDAGGNHFTAKKYVIVHPEEQPKVYKSVISHVEIPLPEHPMRYSAAPNAIPGQGIWAACGVNEKNVAMTATETITSNPVLTAIFKGIRPAVVALIVAPVITTARSAGIGWKTAWIPAAVALLIWSKWPIVSNPILYIALGGLVGWWLARRSHKILKDK